MQELAHQIMLIQLLYCAQYEPIVELTSLHEQAFLYWTLLLGKKIAKR
jgi:hypothetical protein